MASEHMAGGAVAESSSCTRHTHENETQEGGGGRELHPKPIGNIIPHRKDPAQAVTTLASSSSSVHTVKERSANGSYKGETKTRAV
jgi:hypothetical protein